MLRLVSRKPNNEVHAPILISQTLYLSLKKFTRKHRNICLYLSYNY